MDFTSVARPYSVINENRFRAICVSYTIEVAQQTGPLGAISGKSVLVLADAQNLNRGARELGFKVSWAMLGKLIDAVTSWASRHVILSKHPGEDRRMNYYTERGWIPHAKEIRIVRTRNGFERKSNVDFLFAFLAGVLVSRASVDVVIIASGDGDLVEEAASGIRNLKKDRCIVTLSLAGSTASRLNAETSPFISANLELGQDCLRKISKEP